MLVGQEYPVNGGYERNGNDTGAFSPPPPVRSDRSSPTWAASPSAVARHGEGVDMSQDSTEDEFYQQLMKMKQEHRRTLELCEQLYRQKVKDTGHSIMGLTEDYNRKPPSGKSKHAVRSSQMEVMSSSYVPRYSSSKTRVKDDRWGTQSLDNKGQNSSALLNGNDTQSWSERGDHRKRSTLDGVQDSYRSRDYEDLTQKTAERRGTVK